jgi:hypothetical protein
MLQRYPKHIYLFLICALLSVQSIAYPLGAAHKAAYSIQSKATELAQYVGQSVIKTNYGHLVRALQQLDDAQLLPVDQLVDPLTPLYELTKALNVAGREYFLVPELKLYIAQVAYRFAQRMYLSVYEKKRPVAAETKTAMLKHLDTTLSLLDPSKEPVTAVIFHLRYVRAVVENLPDSTSGLQANTYLLLRLIKAVIEQNAEAGVDVLEILVSKGKQIYRGKLVEEITAVEVLVKALLRYGEQQAFLDLIDLYKETGFEETQYAIMRALGALSRAYYGEQSIDSSNEEVPQQAFTAFSTLIEVATPKDLKQNDSYYVKCAAVIELILLQNLLDPQHSKVVERYLEDIAKNDKKTPKSWFARLIAKISGTSQPSPVQCILEHRDVIFRMANIGQQHIAEVPQDSINAALERIELQQKRILEQLKICTIPLKGQNAK